MIISDSIPFPFLFMCLLRVSKHYIINNQGRSQNKTRQVWSAEGTSRWGILRACPPSPPPDNFLNLEAQKCSFNQSNFFQRLSSQLNVSPKKNFKKPKSRQGNRFMLATALITQVLRIYLFVTSRSIGEEFILNCRSC